MSVKEALKARREQHINEMVSTNPMIGQLNTQFTSWLLGSGLTGAEIIKMIEATKVVAARVKFDFRPKRIPNNT